MTPTNGVSPTAITNSSGSTAAPRTNRRYKTQLRDFLSTCRSKRKVSQHANQQQPPTPTTPNQISTKSPNSIVEFITDPAVVAAAYSNLNPIYSPSPYAPSSSENIYMSQTVHSGSFYPTAENLFHQYRLQGSYYPEYHHHHHHPSSPYVANGFLPYESYNGGGGAVGVPSTKEEKWQEDNKYYGSELNGSVPIIASGRTHYNSYGSPTNHHHHVIHAHHTIKTPKTSPALAIDVLPTNKCNTALINSTIKNVSSNGVLSIQPKIETSPPPPQPPSASHRSFSDQSQRQTVLMWGTGNAHQTNENTSTATSPSSTRSPNNTPRSANATPSNNNLYSHNQHYNNSNQQHHIQQQQTMIDSLNLHPSSHQHHNKWNENTVNSNSKDVISVFPLQSNTELYSTTNSQSPSSNSIHSNDHHHHHHQHLGGIGSNCEVFPAYSQYQYFSYHHIQPSHHQHASSTQ